MGWSKKDRLAYHKIYNQIYKNGMGGVEVRQKTKAILLKNKLEAHQKTIFVGGYDQGEGFPVLENEGLIL